MTEKKLETANDLYSHLVSKKKVKEQINAMMLELDGKDPDYHIDIVYRHKTSTIESINASQIMPDEIEHAFYVALLRLKDEIEEMEMQFSKL